MVSLSVNFLLTPQRTQLAGPLAPQWQGWRQLQVLVQAVETGFVEDHRKRTP